MNVRFWGVRGSISTPELDKLQVGGNTSCVEVELDENKRIILDAGTGIRALGSKVHQEIVSGKNNDVILLLSHTHWDHIQGLVFFTPLFNQASNVHIYGLARANRQLKKLLAGQMEYDYWPIKLTQLPATTHFDEWKDGEYTLFGDVKVTAKRHIHPGSAFGFRIEYKGKVVTYSTDTEHFQNLVDTRVVELSKNADVLIHDAQYVDSEMEFKLGWGHSTWTQAIQVANDAKAKKLVLFHHDPGRTDEQAFAIEREAQAVRPDTVLAREGMVIEV